MSAPLEVQAAVVAALKADATFGSLAADRIYDRVPDEETAPYAHIVSVQSAPDIETQDDEGVDVLLRIDVWGNLRLTVQQIMDAQKAAIHEQSLSLATLENVIGREIQQRTLRYDKAWFQGIHRFRFLTD